MLRRRELTESTEKVTGRLDSVLPANPSVSDGVFPWVLRSGIAVLDQGLIAGSNFVTGVLLARWLRPGDYGAYALAYGLFLLLTLVYGSIVLEPMSVFGGATYQDCLTGYLRSLFRIYRVIATLNFVVLGASALVSQWLGAGDGLPGALAGASLAAPCILFFWLVRCAFYLKFSPLGAALGSVLYSVLVLGGLAVVHARELISPFAAFLLMGLGALVTGALLLMYLKGILRDTGIAPSVLETWRKHWNYGRWALVSSIVSWVPAYIFYPLLGRFSSMAQAGELRALMNFAMPLTQVQAALSMLLIPYAATTYARSGRAGAGALTMRITLLSALGSALYWVLPILFRKWAFHVVYSDRYLAVVDLLPSVAVGAILWATAYGASIVLRAMESPESILAAYCFATATSVLVGVPATWRFGLAGAIWGINVSDGVAFIVAAYLLYRKVRNPLSEVGTGNT